MSSSVVMEALYELKKVEGRPSDLTLEKTTQQFGKYFCDSVHVLETELTKEKVKLLGHVRLPHRCSDRFIKLSRIFGDSLQTLTALRDSLESH